MTAQFTTRHIGRSTVQDIVAAVVTHRQTGKTRTLTAAEYARFFDNRDPSKWTVTERNEQ